METAVERIAVENGEGNRVLLITSSRRTPIAYPDRGGTYQYFDQTGVTRAMTKWSGSVPSFERLPEFFRRAARISWRICELLYRDAIVQRHHSIFWNGELAPGHLSHCIGNTQGHFTPFSHSSVN